jgi:hypothetical protein
MCIIVLEHCIRLFYIRYARLPVDAVKQAFLINTNQSFFGEWVEKLLSAHFHFTAADTLSYLKIVGKYMENNESL